MRLVSNTKDIIKKENENSKPASLKTAALFGDPQYYLGSQPKQELSNSEIKGYSEANSIGRLSEKDFKCTSDWQIKSLPETREEALTSAEYLRQKGYITQVFLGDSATEDTLKKLNSPTILFLTTHGYFCEDVTPDKETFLPFDKKRVAENPLLRSGLMLAGAGNTIENKGKISTETDKQAEDGILTAYEAMNLNLDSTDLVVLSACQTGLGDIKNGEGVYGLQRAFLVAGAKSLIMSLWSVPPKETKELMISFFEFWLSSKGMSKREAFKKAQLTIKEKYKHPYYWGAFVMIGE